MGSAFMRMDTNFFLDLLVKQLQYQNPMDPVSNKDMMVQLSQLSMTENMNNVADGFKEMLKMYRLSAGVDMVGRDVEFEGDDGVVRGGRVDEVIESDGKYRLVVGDEVVDIEKVIRVK